MKDFGTKALEWAILGVAAACVGFTLLLALSIVLGRGIV